MEVITLNFFISLCKVFLLVRLEKKDFFDCLHNLHIALRLLSLNPKQ